MAGLVRRGGWSKEEDALLRQCVETYGEGKWHQVPLKAGLNRCRKSCRLRWVNYLKPDIKRGEFSTDEVDLIIRLHRLLGNRWSLIAGRLPGRTANDVKNLWNTRLRKKTINARAALHRTNKVIKPHSQSFSKSQVLQLTRQRQQGQLLPCAAHIINNVVDNSSKVAPDSSKSSSTVIVSTEEDDVEQIQWWKSLLNNDDTEFSHYDKTVASGSSSIMEKENCEITDAKDGKGSYEEWLSSPSDELFFDMNLWDFLTDD